MSNANPYSLEFQSQLLTELDNLKRGLETLHVQLDLAVNQVSRRSAELAKVQGEIAGAGAAAPAQSKQDGGFISDVRAVLEALKAGVRPAADRLHRIDAHLQGSCAS